MPARVISNDPGDADSEELCQGSLASTDADEQQLLRGPAMPTVHQFACFRESPRPCVNQELVDQFAPLRSYRFLKYGSTSADRGPLSREQRALTPSDCAYVADHEKFISYATAVSVIIGTPFRITSVEQARKLPKVRHVKQV